MFVCQQGGWLAGSAMRSAAADARERSVLVMLTEHSLERGM